MASLHLLPGGLASRAAGAPAGPGLVPGLAVGAGAEAFARRGAAVLGPGDRRARWLDARVAAMRARGMSDTAIRRALGLSEAAAVAHGIIASRLADGPGARGPSEVAAGGEEAEEAGRNPAARARDPALGPRLLEVVAAVARAGGVGRDALLGTSQARGPTRLRHLAMLLLRELCPGASLPAIGHLFGRDHTTVHHGCRRAATLRATEPAFAALYARARAELATTSEESAETADGEAG